MPSNIHKHSDKEKLESLPHHYTEDSNDCEDERRKDWLVAEPFFWNDINCLK